MTNQFIANERVLGDGEFVNQVLKILEEEMVKKEWFKNEGWDKHIERFIVWVKSRMDISVYKYYNVCTHLTMLGEYL
jgi:hypothetical protein